MFLQEDGVSKCTPIVLSSEEEVSPIKGYIITKDKNVTYITIRREQKFNSLPRRQKQIRRFEQRPFVGN